MEEYEIRKILDKGLRFAVEIEFFKSKDRRTFTFPYGDEWETEEKGVPKFIEKINKILNREDNIEKKVDLNKFKGKKFKATQP